MIRLIVLTFASILSASAFASPDYSLDIACYSNFGQLRGTLHKAGNRMNTTLEFMEEEFKTSEPSLNKANELVISFRKTLKDVVPRDDLEAGLMQCQAPCDGLDDRTRVKIQGQLKIPYERGTVRGLLSLKSDVRTIGRRKGRILPFALWPKDRMDKEAADALSGAHPVECDVTVK